MSDEGFPQAHTCFFQLDIPFYKTDEMCYNRLSAAAEMCGGIDTDFTVQDDGNGGGGGDEEE